MKSNIPDEQKSNAELRAELAEMRQQLEALGQSEAGNLTAVLREISDGLVIVDLQGIVRFANPVAEKLLQHPGNTLVGTKLELPLGTGDRLETNIAGADNGEVPVELKSSETVWEGNPALRVLIRDLSGQRRGEEALREREEVMRYIIKYDPNALAVYDRTLRYIAVSDRYLQDYKVKEADVIGKHHYEVFPEMPQRWKDVHQRVLQGVVEKNDDDFFERSDGSITYNRWECRPWYTAQNEIGGMITYTEVTTERKQAEFELLKSEEKYRRLTENSPDVIYRMSLPDGVYEYINSAAKEVFGYPPQVFYEDPAFIKNIIHPDSQAYFKEQWQLLLAGNPPPTYEYKVLHKDGSSRWIYQRNVFVRREGGGIKAIEGIVTDITELKRTEEKLTQQRNLFETMFNTIPDGVVITNTNREILLANKGLKTIFGYSEEELQGKTTAVLYADTEKYRETGAAVFNKDASSRSEFFHTHYRAKDGRNFPGEAFGAKLYDAQNKWIGNLGIMRDVSEREHQEQERQKLQNQLLQAQKMESIGTLAGGIAHDFNNILSAILGFSELAKNQLEEGSVIASDLDEVYTAGVRAKDLVRQILAFARQSSEEVKPLQVDMIIKEVIKFIRSSTPVTIDIKQAIGSRSLVMGNPTQIYQVLMNLCTNAIQAMKNESGTMTVSLQDVFLDESSEATTVSKAPGKYIEIKVADSGEGIAPEHLAQIFEPYFTTKPQGEGTGLGLSVVHGIVESYGGTILVDSMLHEGTSFTIYLPIISERKADKVPLMDELPRGSEHILFVDDEAPIARMGAKMLESLGYKVTFRTSSLEALELFKAKPRDFDLLVTDMTMPNMTGDELAASVTEKQPDLPVILCTGYSTKINEKSAKKRGISGFIYKPVVKADFARLVRSVIDRENDSAL